MKNMENDVQLLKQLLRAKVGNTWQEATTQNSESKLGITHRGAALRHVTRLAAWQRWTA